MRRNALLALSVVVVLPVVGAVVGCGSSSSSNDAGDLMKLQESYNALMAEVNRTQGNGPDVVTCANMQLNLAQATSTGAGVGTAAAAATFTGVSALDATLNFAGSYTQSASGVTVTLTGQGYDDGIDRAVVLSLGNPGEDDGLCGTLEYTRGDAVYSGDIELSPESAD